MITGPTRRSEPKFAIENDGRPRPKTDCTISDGTRIHHLLYRTLRDGRPALFVFETTGLPRWIARAPDGQCTEGEVGGDCHHLLQLAGLPHDATFDHAWANSIESKPAGARAYACLVWFALCGAHGAIVAPYYHAGRWRNYDGTPADIKAVRDDVMDEFERIKEPHSDMPFKPVWQAFVRLARERRCRPNPNVDEFGIRTGGGMDVSNAPWVQAGYQEGLLWGRRNVHLSQQSRDSHIERVRRDANGGELYVQAYIKGVAFGGTPPTKKPTGS